MYRLSKPLFLIGFMGAGKTSIARRLARSCGLASIDMDTFIVRREGREISDIFAENGEAAFREIETQVLQEIAAMDDNLVVSCGGGIVTKPENLEIMSNSGYVLHLLVTADQAAERITNTSSRPLFDNIDSARERCIARMPLYEQAADLTVDTAGKTVAQIAGEIKRKLEEEGVLCQQRR